MKTMKSLQLPFLKVKMCPQTANRDLTFAFVDYNSNSVMFLEGSEKKKKKKKRKTKNQNMF